MGIIPVLHLIDVDVPWELKTDIKKLGIVIMITGYFKRFISSSISQMKPFQIIPVQSDTPFFGKLYM